MNAPLKPIDFNLSSPSVQPSGWRAHLELGFSTARESQPGKSRTLLSHRRRSGPLAVQRALYPEGDVCHVYLLHPPGGIVGGDQLDIEVDVSSNAHALITAPGATKFYRSIANEAVVSVSLDVRGDLEWLPHENILFQGAVVNQQTIVNLVPDARFIGWETHCFGRPSSQESFDAGSAIFSTNIYRDGQPLHLDRLRVGEDELVSSAARRRNHAVCATLYATPVAKKVAADMQSRFHQSGDTTIGITLIDGLLIARYLGESTASARACMVALWQALRPVVLERRAITPRIWAT